MFIVLFKAHSHSLQEQTHFIVEDEDDGSSDTAPIESDNDNEVIVVSCAQVFSPIN